MPTTDEQVYIPRCARNQALRLVDSINALLRCDQHRESVAGHLSYLDEALEQLRVTLRGLQVPCHDCQVCEAQATRVVRSEHGTSFFLCYEKECEDAVRAVEEYDAAASCWETLDSRPQPPPPKRARHVTWHDYDYEEEEDDEDEWGEEWDNEDSDDLAGHGYIGATPEETAANKAALENPVYDNF